GFNAHLKCELKVAPSCTGVKGFVRPNPKATRSVSGSSNRSSIVSMLTGGSGVMAPAAESSPPIPPAPATGRDHNGGTSVTWLAGAGVKGGVAHGESDPWSWKAADGATTGYDLHATILHLLGIDHERLTVRHDGIDRRLTDVHGKVVKSILA
ncbi:hypothetical protein HK102_012922, partial [Quaeritorhiza haematococci]